MHYLLLTLAAVAASVLREYLNSISRARKVQAFRVQLRKDKAREANDYRRRVSETAEAIKAAEALMPVTDRRIIQLMTANNKRAAEVESLKAQLGSVQNKHRITGEHLRQIQGLNGEHRGQGTEQLDAKRLENLKIELVILKSNAAKLAERLAKYATNNQKIIKTVNETTIKNFEIQKEVEDHLARALQEIHLENSRLRSFLQELQQTLTKHKSRIVDLLSDLSSFKDSALAGFVNLKAIELRHIVEKTNVTRNSISNALVDAFEKRIKRSSAGGCQGSREAQVAEFVKTFFPQYANASHIDGLRLAIRQNANQSLFEIESIEHEIKQAKKKLLLAV